MSAAPATLEPVTSKPIPAEVKATARTYTRARAKVEAMHPEVVAAVESAAAAGVSEVALAELFGVTRMTIRRWLGKRQG